MTLDQRIELGYVTLLYAYHKLLQHKSRLYKSIIHATMTRRILTASAAI